ncbi:hypothetical protein GCM10023083_63720 [Streptomyces phyllanthi]
MGAITIRFGTVSPFRARGRERIWAAREVATVTVTRGLLAERWYQAVCAHALIFTGVNCPTHDRIPAFRREPL